MFENALVVDVETTSQPKEKGFDPTPYHPKNYLVSAGLRGEDVDGYWCVKHDEEPPTQGYFAHIQGLLDKTQLLVAHNMKFDLSWLLECGFKYDGAVWDTMICEFVLARSVRTPLNLSACCERRGIETKKSDLTYFYLKKGIGFEAMPWDVVKEYGIQDVDITWFLFKDQYKEFYDGE